ncbi:MAG TPA: ATP-binding protein [Ktedonobacteraceae bacterium]
MAAFLQRIRQKRRTQQARRQAGARQIIADETGTWEVLGTRAIPSETGNERLAVSYVVETLNAVHLPERRLDQLGTAVAEATMNAMEHGNHYDAHLPVTLQVLLSHKAIAVRVSDQGGNDMPDAQDGHREQAEHELPDLEAKLAGLQSPRGWGLFLIEHMVDELHVLKHAKTHTIELVVHLEGENMSSSSTSPTPEDEPRDMANWARRDTHTLHIDYAPSGALNLNVDGRQITSPLQGFGQMWQKTYRVRLTEPEITPTGVISAWKEHFAEFWPEHSRFFGPLTGIAPGEVALLNLQVSGMPLSTGVLVLYADDESFTLMTPQGHVFAGWITFSAYANEEGETVAQAQVLIRASDPIYEIGLRFFGGHRQEDRFWQHTLTQVATYFKCTAAVEMEIVCVDTRIQWSEARNIWHNSVMRTTLHRLVRPSLWMRGRAGKKPAVGK